MILTWRDRLILLSPLAAIGVLAVAPSLEDGPTVCPFALCTGIACPGCGMTRAAGYLLRGDMGTALTYHPLVPAIVVMAATGWAWFVLRKMGKVRPMSGRMLNVILIATFVALMAAWIGRLATGSLPPV